MFNDSGNIPVTSVTNIAEFKKKYGVQATGFRLVLEAFIQRAPEFPGDEDLAKHLGVMMADLESALKGE